MWPILLSFLITIGVLFERWIVLRRGKFDSQQFLLRLKSLYRHGDMAAVLSYCSQKDVPLTGIVRRGVLKRGLGPARVREVVESAAHEEMYHMERHLGILAAMSTIAPMLGLIGSVVGLMTAFGRQGAAMAQPDLASGIWQALLCTAFGLVVGLVASIGYNALVARIKRLVHELETASNEFLDLVEEPEAGSDGTNGDELTIALRAHAVELDPFQRKE